MRRHFIDPCTSLRGNQVYLVDDFEQIHKMTAACQVSCPVTIDRFFWINQSVYHGGSIRLYDTATAQTRFHLGLNLLRFFFLNFFSPLCPLNTFATAGDSQAVDHDYFFLMLTK